MSPSFGSALKRVGSHLRRKTHRQESSESTPDKEVPTTKTTENDSKGSLRPRQKSLSLHSNIFVKRQRPAAEASDPTIPALPPELIEKVASFLSQVELVKFCRASKACYIAAERYLYRRPFTRRFDKLLKTFEKVPYKADYVLELALGFETDFYSVKYGVF
jgi:hypothetical protein